MCACHVCVLCTQVDVWCSQTQQRIVGYYQANACASDSRWEPPHRLTTPAGLVVWPRTKPLLASVKPVCVATHTALLCFPLHSLSSLEGGIPLLWSFSGFLDFGFEFFPAPLRVASYLIYDMLLDVLVCLPTISVSSYMDVLLFAFLPDSPTPCALKIADKISEQCSNAVLLMVSSMQRDEWEHLIREQH